LSPAFSRTQTLRARLLSALLSVAVLGVGAATVLFLRELSRQLARELSERGQRASLAFANEREAMASALEAELVRLSDGHDPLAQACTGGDAAARWLAASRRLRPGRVDVLKVLDPDGAILSSGHWPASLGAIDPGAERYSGAATGAGAMHEPTPQGVSFSLQRWRSVRWGERDLRLVVGRILDAAAVDSLRTRLGLDVLALCSSRAASPKDCTQSGLDPPDSESWPDSVEFTDVSMDSDPASPFLRFGLDRGPLLRLGRAVRLRAVLLGILAGGLATVLGLRLARGVVRPVEAMASATGRIAAGELSVRVNTKPSRIEELDALVAGFDRMAADLERSRGRLRHAERVAAWQEIARGLAHELKNPLTPILSAMDVIRKARRLDRPDFDAILAEQSQAVVEEVMRLKELADSFARFARLPEAHPEPLDLAALLDSVLALYVPKGGSVTLRRDYSEGLPTLHADRAQLMTVFNNLVKNAVEAMNGSGDLRITIRAAEAGWVEVQVDDNGPGIDPAIRDRLFTPYLSTKGSRGTGLGLAMAHRVISEHGGSIEAQDASGPAAAGRAPPLGGGASFLIRLPVSPAPLPPVAPPEPRRGPGSSPPRD
jgi:signal transduction histidine kinase